MKARLPKASDGEFPLLRVALGAMSLTFGIAIAAQEVAGRAITGTRLTIVAVCSFAIVASLAFYYVNYVVDADDT